MIQASLFVLPETLLNMTLMELRYLVAVAETRHFGRAADRFNVSQSTLSMAVRKLEEDLGVPN